jgi:predicted molibdopterin-dependent oxidoreductase YjgC
MTLAISRKLLKVTGPVTIDFKEDGRDSGFVVDSENILPVVDSDCDSCGGGCC